MCTKWKKRRNVDCPPPTLHPEQTRLCADARQCAPSLEKCAPFLSEGPFPAEHPTKADPLATICCIRPLILMHMELLISSFLSCLLTCKILRDKDSQHWSQLALAPMSTSTDSSSWCHQRAASLYTLILQGQYS